MRDENGLTLTELLVGLIVIAMLAVVAMPRLGALVQGNRVDAVVEDAASDMAFAISEATRRGLPVTVCPAAGEGDACDAAGVWRDDWMTFVDVNGDGTRDADDKVLRRRGGWGTGVTIGARSAHATSRLQRLTADADGLFTSLPADARLVFDVPAAITDITRCLRFSNVAAESVSIGSGRGACA
ncbi:GspH/FimT family pseudopilin [Cupriavidus plantarum]|uniref:GspH/FimT family pseudopilin n=1 Tax=Cupriavidus plantarum TaxID=942865 RepID=UPI000E367905|nr:GspH/FimT family pseudopilin [Cupriavidus plantarum]REE93851.1 type IV fimbrial biogenesis protein FimT [Cupriavidus plantarum]CAG2134415.1 hypothetical protein LMG26296_02023 [Cupriavidus plantarum]SMR84407.1 type IV fimbrial biogenesis protein FimT [Cupriavidus plantarum]